MKSLSVFTIIVLCVISNPVNADDNGARIGIGKTLINSHSQVAEVSYEYNNWEASAALVGESDTANGFQEQLEIYSLSYLTKPPITIYGLEPYFRLGVSDNSGSRLVGTTNYRLGIGVDLCDFVRVEYTHHSSAGIHETNWGIDYVSLVYKILPLF